MTDTNQEHEARGLVDLTALATDPEQLLDVLFERIPMLALRIISQKLAFRMILLSVRADEEVANIMGKGRA